MSTKLVSRQSGGEKEGSRMYVNGMKRNCIMSKLTIIPHANATGPVVSGDVLKIGPSGLPMETERSIEASKKQIAVQAEQAKEKQVAEKRGSKSRGETAKRTPGAATSSIANMSAIIKEGGPFGPIASVLVPVLAAAFAVYLYLSAGEGGVTIEGERGKRTLFRWLDVIIGVVVAAAVLSFAR